MQNSKKIICVGHQKTGTSSLALALRRLGFRVGTVAKAVNDNANWEANDVRDEIWSFVKKTLTERDAIQDSPCPYFFKEMDEHFPDSKFILTVREPQKWQNSYIKYFGDENNNLRKWMYGVEKYTGNEDLYAEKYYQQNEIIKDYFSNRPGDLLVMDLSEGDGWVELVQFLGKSHVPKFPHRNSAKELAPEQKLTRKQIEKRRERRAKRRMQGA